MSFIYTYEFDCFYKCSTQTFYTVYSMKYVIGFVVLCFISITGEMVTQRQDHQSGFLHPETGSEIYQPWHRL